MVTGGGIWSVISDVSAMSLVDDVSVVVVVVVVEDDEVTQGLAALTSLMSHPRSAEGSMKVSPPLESVTMQPGHADAVMENIVIPPMFSSTLPSPIRQPAESVTSVDVVEYDAPAPMVPAQVASMFPGAETNRAAVRANEKRMV